MTVQSEPINVSRPSKRSKKNAPKEREEIVTNNVTKQTTKTVPTISNAKKTKSNTNSDNQHVVQTECHPPESKNVIPPAADSMTKVIKKLPKFSVARVGSTLCPPSSLANHVHAVRFGPMKSFGSIYITSGPARGGFILNAMRYCDEDEKIRAGLGMYLAYKYRRISRDNDSPILCEPTASSSTNSPYKWMHFVVYRQDGITDETLCKFVKIIIKALQDTDKENKKFLKSRTFMWDSSTMDLTNKSTDEPIDKYLLDEDISDLIKTMFHKNYIWENFYVDMDQDGPSLWFSWDCYGHYSSRAIDTFGYPKHEGYGSRVNQDTSVDQSMHDLLADV